MSKKTIDSLIRNMQKSGLVTKAAPWMVEGVGERELSVRYVGLRVDEDWNDVMSSHNNLLIKFLVDKKSGWIEYYLANKPPFLKIMTANLTDADKWETLLGELKRRLRKDKEEYDTDKEKVSNIYRKIKDHIK